MLKRLVIAFATAATLVAGSVGSAFAERRVALVIGNSGYQNTGKLPNPANDADDVTAALQKLNFEVIALKDLDKRGMDDAFRRFARAVGGAEVALFYYAGHAMQFNGVNYLMPIDAKLKDEADLKYEMAKLDDVIEEMKRAKGVRLVVLDGCRDNPLEQQLKQRSIGRLGRSGAATRGLAAIDGSAEGMLIAFATGAGATADDGDGRNSPFTAAFLKHVNTPGLEVSAMFKRIRAEVFSATGNRQRPDIVDSLIGDFSFRKAAPTPGFDTFAWGLVKDTTDKSALQRFIQQFPDSPLRKEAEQRLALLNASPPVAAVNPLPAPVQPPVAPVQPPGITPIPAPFTPPVAPPVDPRAVAPTGTPTELCDRLAGSPHEADRAPGSPGVELDRIDAPRAIPACTQAMAANPGVQRFQFALGRSHLKAGDHAKAREAFAALVALNHPGAMNAIGSMIEQGQGMAKDEAQARQWFERAAQMGSLLAMFNMGKFHDEGKGGLTRDPQQAKQWWTRAANAGLADAMASLGEYLMDGIGGPQNDAEARQWFERAAALGEARSMVNIGFFFENGRAGYPKDDVQARQWYERAAARGNAIGASNLGVFYEFGRGGAKDIQQAKALYELAARRGSSGGMTNLAWLLESGATGPADPAAARQWYQRAVDLNSARAMSNLGYLYETGKGGPKDLNEARRLYELAAERNFAQAMVNLGDLYDEGTGVARNQATAKVWYEKAANLGNTGGLTSLAYYYEQGLGGVPKNLVEAVKLYERAANQGGARAQNNLGVLYENGSGVQQSYEQARYWYEQAANNGNRFAMNNLGVLLELGRGGAKNEARAFELYNKAADLGHNGAMYNIGLMHANGVYVRKDDVQARVWYEKAVNTGHFAAMNNLAILLENGRGGPVDFGRAKQLYERSVSGGNFHAMFNLGLMHQAGRGVPKNDTEARSWFDRAGRAGHVGAMDSLAILLMNGRGGPVDAQRAATLFLSALQRNDADARRRLIGEAGRNLTADVRFAVQGILQREGLGGTVDGNFGAATIQALESYARKR